jgi:hypothetical protein
MPILDRKNWIELYKIAEIPYFNTNEKKQMHNCYELNNIEKKIINVCTYEFLWYHISHQSYVHKFCQIFFLDDAQVSVRVYF